MYGHVFTHTHMFMETKKLHHKTFSTDNQNQLIFRIQNNIQKKDGILERLLSEYWLTVVSIGSQ